MKLSVSLPVKLAPPVEEQEPEELQGQQQFLTMDGEVLTHNGEPLEAPDA